MKDSKYNGLRWRALIGTLALSISACGTNNNAVPLNGDDFIGPGNGAAGQNTYSLVGFDTCEDVEAELKGRLKERMERDLNQRREQLIEYGYDYGYGYGDGPVFAEGEGGALPPRADVDEESAQDDFAGAPTSDSNNSAGSDRVEGKDFSGTNNQESDVDEADFVKTDGHFIYTVQNNALSIFAVPEIGEIETRGSLGLEAMPREILLGEDALVLFSNVYPYQVAEDSPLYERLHIGEGRYRYNNYTRIDVIALDEERNSPSISKSILLEGDYFTARRVENKVRMVSHAHIQIPGLDTNISLGDLSNHSEESRARTVNAVIDALIDANNVTIDELTLKDIAPFAADITNDGFSELTLNNSDCGNFAAVVDGTTSAVTSILSLNLLSGVTTVEADHILANYPTVYASTDVLVLAEAAQPQWWYTEEAPEDATNLHRFDISGDNTIYTGSGQVPGQIIGQFALSEFEGDVRVATTRNQFGTWWQEEPAEMSNWLFVLNGENTLEQRGSVGPLAETERIWSARFRGDEAFLVTFRQTDPLWTIDISDPDNPKTVGELHIPGVSTYIHPIDDDTLLTIGLPGDDSGWLDWSRDRISLFDITDRADPMQTDILDLGGENGWGQGSEARYEHKAFQYFDGILAVPQSRYEQVYAGCNDRYYENEPECWEECWEAEDGEGGCEVVCEDGSTRPIDGEEPTGDDLVFFYEECEALCEEELGGEACPELCDSYRSCFDGTCEGDFENGDCASECMFSALTDAGYAIEDFEDGTIAEEPSPDDSDGFNPDADNSEPADEIRIAPPISDCLNECIAQCEEEACGVDEETGVEYCDDIDCRSTCEFECDVEEETEESCRYPYYNTVFSSGLALVDVEPGVGLTSRGLITQGEVEQTQQNDCYGYNQAGIRRSIFMGEFIYTVSSSAITVHRLDSLEKVDAARITVGEPSHDPYGCYYEDDFGGIDGGATTEPARPPEEG